MANFIMGLKRCDSEDVIAELDGDDYLLHRDVALELAHLHRQYDVVWTQHEINHNLYPDWHTWYSTGLPDNWTRTTPWRKTLWTRYMHPGHLRTFKRKYFDLINVNDLKLSGSWVKSASDAAYYTPIVELAPPVKRYFYARPCVCYRVTQVNDFLQSLQAGVPKLEKQHVVAKHVFNLPPYDPVEEAHLFFPLFCQEHANDVLSLVKYMKKKHLFSSACVGLPGSETIEDFEGLNSIRFYDIHRMIRNQKRFVNTDGSVRVSPETFWAIGVRYVLLNTSANEVVVFMEPEKQRVVLQSGNRNLRGKSTTKKGINTIPSTRIFRRNEKDIMALDTLIANTV